MYTIHTMETIQKANRFPYNEIEKEQWKTSLQQLKTEGTQLVVVSIPWSFHELTEGHICVAETTHDLACLMDFAYGVGLYVIIELHLFRHLPSWLFQCYPEIQARHANGSVIPHSVSVLHPTYLTLLGKWYDELLPIILPRLVKNGGCIAGISLNTENGPCELDYHVNCLRILKQWLIEKHPQSYIYSLFESKHSCSTVEELARSLQQLQLRDGTRYKEVVKRFYDHYTLKYIGTLQSMLSDDESLPFITMKSS